MNTKVDILSRKDQVNMKKDNKDVKILKDELWTRRVTTEVEVAIIQGNQVVEETTLLEEIRRNQTREQELQKELEKDRTDIGRQWNSLHGWKNLHSKQ